MYKINFILFFALCLGFSSTLYAVGNDENNEQKAEKIVDIQPYRSSSGYNPMLATPQASIYRNNMSSKPTQLIIWNCKSIEKCSALVTVIGCLQYWQQLNNFDELNSILSYLHRDNRYMDIVGAYHHLLSAHICNKKDKNEYSYINAKLQKGIGCKFTSCKCYMRKQSEKKHKIDTEKDDKEYIFLRNLLDTIHTYLVHGCDSGHRYLQYDGDAKDNLKALFDLPLVKLKQWQASLKKLQRSKSRSNRYLTKIGEANKAADDQAISLSLLKAKFGTDNTLTPWMIYLVANECDTDCILEEIVAKDDEIVLSMHKAFFYKIRVFIKQKQAQQKNAYTSIGLHSFGIRLYYWKYYQYSNEKDSFLNVDYNPGYLQKNLYVAPAYLFFKNEMLAKGISMTTWNQKMYETGAILSLSDTLKKAKSNAYNPLCDRYNVKKNSGLSIWHVASILFYTNFTTLCVQFSASFRYLSPTENLEKLIKRNAKWHHLAKNLREVVEIFGEEIGYDDKGQFCDKGPLYHLVSSALFSQPNLYFHGPLSTSQQLAVATLFAQNDGLIVGLKQDDRALKLFNVSLVSPFPQEDERLLIGGQFPLHISNIRLYRDNITIKPVMYLLFVIDKMIKGEYVEDKITHSDISMFNKLVYGAKDIPFYAQQVWEDFTYKQQMVKINMLMMYRCYQLFVPMLFSSVPKLKHLLLFDKVVKIFPNVKHIICEKIDCIGWNSIKGWKYSPLIVDTKFIRGLKGMANNISQNSTNKLEKIIIRTDACEIKGNLYAPQFDKLGWDIRKENKFTISLTNEPYEVVYKGLISKIKSMIAGDALAYDEVTYLDVLIFNKLVVGANDLPHYVKQRWDEFRNVQRSITINVYYMCKYYTLFVPVLLSSDPKFKNLLLFDKILKIFPNATQVICENTDYDSVLNKATQSYYSSAIVGANFIKGLKDMLHKMGQHQWHKLKKIIIKTSKYEIKADCDVYVRDFGVLGWHIQKESCVNYRHQNTQISLTKIGSSSEK